MMSKQCKRIQKGGIMMRAGKATCKNVSRFILGAVFLILSTSAAAQSLDEVYKQALKEGGTLNFYGTLAQINAEKILPVFEKRFPGIKVNHIDATSDKLVARAVTEARGGKTLGDIFQVPLENVVQLHDQGLLLETKLPESADYPEGMKGSFWGGLGSSVLRCGM